MERTYNVFTDNGLFVLANHLDKEISDITNEDIINSTSYFAKKFEELYGVEKYNKLTTGSFQNSAYTQTVSKDEKTRFNKVNKQYINILNNINNMNGDTCVICGDSSVPKYNKEFISSLTKSMFPRLASNTFFNFSNNFKQLNICPTCLYLGMLSFFNIHPVGGQCILFNSDDDEFMYDYTYEHNVTIEQDIVSNAKLKKDDYIQSMENVIMNTINKNKIYNGYITMTTFYNSSQGESFDTDILNKKDLEFLKLLQSKSLLSEFKKETLFYNMLKGRLQKDYLRCVIKDNELKVSKELFDLIEEEYNKLGKVKLELIKRVCKNINENKLDITKDLKGIDNLKQFEKLIMSIIDNIENVMTMDEFDMLCNYKEFSRVKNRMYVELINFKNEGER